MSRPAKFYDKGKFVRRREKPGSKKLGIDWDRVEPSYNHQGNDRDNLDILRNLRYNLLLAEQAGKQSAANRIRREINHVMENELAISSSPCGTCFQVLHNCRCEDRKVSRSTVYRRRKKEEAQKAAIKSLIAAALGG